MGSWINKGEVFGVKKIGVIVGTEDMPNYCLVIVNMYIIQFSRIIAVVFHYTSERRQDGHIENCYLLLSNV